MSHSIVKIDLHEHTRIQARHVLDERWASRAWNGLRRVEIVHGNGDILRKTVRQWCDEKGLHWSTLSHNAGVTILHPGQQARTSALPPPRPLTKLSELKHLHKELPKPVTKPAIEPKTTGINPPSIVSNSSVLPPPTEEDLLALEFERLSNVDPRDVRRLKSSQQSPKEISLPPINPLPLRPYVISDQPPTIDQPPVISTKKIESIDLFALELERLSEADRRVIQRRKSGS